MAKGAESKQKLFDKLSEIFPDAFMDDKVMRIPFKENGETVEIKVALTCAKDVIGGGNGSASTSTAKVNTPQPQQLAQPTEQEIANVQNLLSRLGMKKPQ